MIKSTLTVILATLFTLPAFSIHQEFFAVKKGTLQAQGLNSQQVIHESQNHFVLKSPLVNFASYDYYFVQLTQDKEFSQWLKEKDEVVLFEPGEFAVLQMSHEKQIIEVAERAHEAGHACGLVQKLSAMPISRNTFDPLPRIVEPRSSIKKTLETVDVANILATMETMVAWQSRFHNLKGGLETAPKLLDLFRGLTPDSRSDVEFELVKHKGSAQESFVVRVVGQTQPDKINILGSHIDSINSRDKANSPGADDNASGTATNLEVFRVLMQQGYKPEQTIEFHGYAAEEIGLVGSGEMAENYKRSGKDVRAMVQFDMNGYTKSNAKITFVSNGTNSSLNRQLSQLVGNYLKVPAKSGFLFFGSSDHASWNKRGFPASFPTEDPRNFNREIHTARDTMNNINSPEQIEAFAQLGVAYLMHFAGVAP